MPRSRVVSRACLLALAGAGWLALPGCVPAFPLVARAMRGAQESIDVRLIPMDERAVEEQLARSHSAHPDRALDAALYRAVAAAHVREWTPIDRLTPVESGPGILVLDPAAPGMETGAKQFGSGCGRWLHLTVGGHPELGKTPLLSALTRVQRELGKPDLGFSLADGIKAAHLTGATHVAVGTLAGKDNLTLTYRLYEVAGQKPVGAPMTVSGTRQQVLSRLPDTARKLAAILGVKQARVPVMDLTPADLELLGRTYPLERRTWARPDRDGLETLGKRVPLAELLLMADGMASERMAAGRRLAAQLPENPLVLAAIAEHHGELAKIAAAPARRLTERYPRSYLAAHADVWGEREVKRMAAERKSAERAVRAAPNNPEAWLALANSTSNVASDVRKGRFSDDLSRPEQQFVGVIYDEWVRITLRAAKLDPRCAKSWARVATAATFAGDEKLARAAYWKVARLPMDAETREDWLRWGLQMFQPKWSDQPGDLRRVAEMTLTNRYSSVGKASEVVESLKDAGFRGESRELQQRLLDQYTEAARATPDDPGLHWELGYLLSDLNENQRAYEEYAQLVRLRPHDGGAHYEVGVALERLHRNAEANNEYREAARLQPSHALARFQYGWALKEERKFAEAEAEFKASLAAAPGYSNAYYGLGQTYEAQRRWADAVAAYRKALESNPWSKEARGALYARLSAEKRWDEMAALWERLLRYNPRDTTMMLELGYAYWMKKDYPSVLRVHEAALALEPDHALALEGHAEALLELGRKEEGRKELERVLTMSDENARAEARKSIARYLK